MHVLDGVDKALLGLVLLEGEVLAESCGVGVYTNLWGDAGSSVEALPNGRVVSPASLQIEKNHQISYNFDILISN